MHDVTKLSDVRIGHYVRIKKNAQNEQSTGIISKIGSKLDDPNGVFVYLANGDAGNVLEITNSPEIIKERIRSETNYSENKDRYFENVMRYEVIPKTIQSFLNSDGGFLYIGIHDDKPTIKEKIVGLAEDRKFLEKSKGVLSFQKFEDELRTDIENVLARLLKSDAELHRLIEYHLWEIDEKEILEIEIKRSTEPVFYKNLSRNQKEIKFEISTNGNKITERCLDEFFVREGSHKKPYETFEQFRRYLKDHFNI
tara:strand:- start:2320 stop:3081 length:762 start_codon:yes stop_codon:yes gene_type:complete